VSTVTFCTEEGGAVVGACKVRNIDEYADQFVSVPLVPRAR
jgi:hypothetical protein